LSPLVFGCTRCEEMRKHTSAPFHAMPLWSPPKKKKEGIVSSPSPFFEKRHRFWFPFSGCF
jgi:hypothetical protein